MRCRGACQTGFQDGEAVLASPRILRMAGAYLVSLVLATSTAPGQATRLDPGGVLVLCCDDSKRRQRARVGRGWQTRKHPWAVVLYLGLQQRNRRRRGDDRSDGRRRMSGCSWSSTSACEAAVCGATAGYSLSPPTPGKNRQLILSSRATPHPAGCAPGVVSTNPSPLVVLLALFLANDSPFSLYVSSAAADHSTILRCSLSRLLHASVTACLSIPSPVPRGRGARLYPPTVAAPDRPPDAPPLQTTCPLTCSDITSPPPAPLLLSIITRPLRRSSIAGSPLKTSSWQPFCIDGCRTLRCPHGLLRRTGAGTFVRLYSVNS